MPSRPLESPLRGGDALIIVPPMAGLDRPALGRTCFRPAPARGFRVEILYANLALAAEIGEANYSAIAYAPTGALAGERFFAEAAFGRDAFALDRDEPSIPWSEGSSYRDDPSLYRRHSARAAAWCEEVAAAAVSRPYRVFGCTTTFEQTSASVAILDRIKALRSDAVTILGGANCDGEMARGIASLGQDRPHLLRRERVDIRAVPRRPGHRPRAAGPIVTGEPASSWTPCRPPIMATTIASSPPSSPTRNSPAAARSGSRTRAAAAAGGARSIIVLSAA